MHHDPHPCHRLLTTAAIILAITPPLLHAADVDPSTQPTLTANERLFEKTMSHAIMTGGFTLDGDASPPKTDRYTISSVRKLSGEDWLFTVRIQYGDHDLPIGLVFPVKWAGDTPVITVADAGIPGIGTFTARVLIYRDHYAGMWTGGPTHRGTLFGRIDHSSK